MAVSNRWEVLRDMNQNQGPDHELWFFKGTFLVIFFHTLIVVILRTFSLGYDFQMLIFLL
jgi:hypothetical protein